MSNRATKGVLRVGSLACDSSGGTKYDQDRIEQRFKVIAFTAGGTTGEIDSGFDLPANGVLRDVYVKITTPSTAAGTMHVGLLASETGGDADGFIASLGTSSSGDKRGSVTTSSSGAAGDFVTGSNRGRLMAAWSSGSTAVDDAGMAEEKPHLIGGSTGITARSVSYTLNTTGTTLAGRIYLDYVVI